MSKFKAAILFNQNQPLEVHSLSHVEPTRGQVKVKVLRAGLCGAQINEMTGVKGPDKFLPHLMGHEGFGRVVATGPEVTRVAVGDHVVMHWRKAAGLEAHGGQYLLPSGIKVGSGPVTTFSEFSIISENRCSPVIRNSKLDDLYPLIGCALSTAYGAVKIESTVAMGAKVLICGGGGLGLALAAILSVVGVKDVTVYEHTSKKNDLISKFAKVQNGSLDELSKSYFDYVFETTGSTDVISAGFSSLCKSGKLILVGQPRVGSKLTLYDPLKFFDGLSVIASDGGGFLPEKHMQELVRLVEANADLFSQLITHKIDIEDINSGFEMMKRGISGRIILEF